LTYTPYSPQVLARDSVSARADVIAHFVKVAKACVNLKNYNTAFAIIAGLRHTAIERMRSTWEASPYFFSLSWLFTFLEKKKKSCVYVCMCCVCVCHSQRKFADWCSAETDQEDGTPPEVSARTLRGRQ
jgi:hypothetical protein